MEETLKDGVWPGYSKICSNTVLLDPRERVGDRMVQLAGARVTFQKDSPVTTLRAATQAMWLLLPATNTVPLLLLLPIVRELQTILFLAPVG
jgi:hypothetical protein